MSEWIVIPHKGEIKQDITKLEKTGLKEVNIEKLLPLNGRVTM